MHRHNWTKQQDNSLATIVGRYGFEDWTMNSQKLKEICEIARKNNRSGKQCRERWYNHLDPQIKKSGWTDDQQVRLFKAQKVHGNKWKQICSELPGRTDNDVKNRFYSTLRRSLRRLNKYIGQKNSTSQMRQIKPSVLTSIIKFIYEKSTSDDKDLLGQLKQLPQLVFRFSTFKPIKQNMNNKINTQVKEKINLILDLVEKFKKTCEGRKKQKSKKQIQATSPEIFVKTEQGIQYSQNQMDEEHSSVIEQQQEQQISQGGLEAMLMNGNPSKKQFPRQIAPIITIRKKSSVGQIKRKNSSLAQKARRKQKYVKIQQDINFLPSIQNINGNNLFQDEQNGLLAPFEEPSISFQQQFQDLVVLGKHIDPIQCQYNPQDFCHVKQEEIDQVLQENYL